MIRFGAQAIGLGLMYPQRPGYGTVFGTAMNPAPQDSRVAQPDSNYG